ncbi:MAG: excinuclease ABC subunit A, partial [Bacteroidales bacterium]|nr:excinuclease ABC subunit A [Bacteroidales bacterium]
MSMNDTKIVVKGARVHNLKNIDVSINRNSFVVVTGLSGSGKSSLAFDTIYAEGQRRYVESLSSYARQFLGRMNKPEVDFIQGLPPAIAIEQKVRSQNPRSTVGTSTEVYDYLKLLFARVGKTYSPISGEIVKKDSVTDVVDYILSHNEGSKLYILSPYHDYHHLDKNQLIEDIKHIGISRILINEEIIKVKELTPGNIPSADEVFIVVDRISVNNDDESKSRFADSVQQAFQLGDNECIIKSVDDNKIKSFSGKFERDGITFEEPNVHTFSFNNPVGACPRCEGYGKVIGIDEDLVIPDKNLSIYEDAVVCWKGEKMSEWKQRLVYAADKFNFPIHKPYNELSNEQQQLVWSGNEHFEGLDAFFEHLEANKYKIQYRVMMARYRGKTTCPECKGTRLKKEAEYVKVNDYSIKDLVNVPIIDLRSQFSSFSFSEFEKKVAGRIITEISNRLDYLVNVGLGYLTLNRLSSTLSGGESQRINLATILGSNLVGSIYVLDEPSIGLHPRDTQRLISVLKQLQKNGNTVLIVEHEEEIIKASDDIVDIGPEAGRFGGEVIFSGKYEELIKENKGLTANYLTGKMQIKPPATRRKWNNFIEIVGAYENNLKSITTKIPLNVMTVVTGVSGSGKS